MNHTATKRLQKLPFSERIGYGAGDAAANFVYMSMILFQANFYTDVLGITASQAATVLLVGRLWDAVAQSWAPGRGFGVIEGSGGG